jgi:hypothetical protein
LVAFDKFLARWAQRWLETHPAVKRTARRGHDARSLGTPQGEQIQIRYKVSAKVGRRRTLTDLAGCPLGSLLSML